MRIRASRLLPLLALLVALAAWLLRAPTPPPPSRPVARAPAIPPAALAVRPEPLEFRPIAPQRAEAINAAIPIAKGPIPAARPFTLPDAAAGRPLECLTQAIYYEAGNESRDGQRAVAQVVLNRLRHPAYPKSVCGVIFQGSERRTGCQFSFTCDGSLARKPSETGWRRAREVAAAALAGEVYAPVGYATHYHASYVVPYWRASLTKLAAIGTHIFYRWAGGAGAPAAFVGRYAGNEPDIAAPSVPERQAEAEPAAPSSDPPARANRGSRAMIPIEAPIAVAASEPIAAPTVDELLPVETGGRRRPGRGSDEPRFTIE